LSNVGGKNGSILGHYIIYLYILRSPVTQSGEKYHTVFSLNPYLLLSRLRPLGLFWFRTYILEIMNLFRHLLGLLGQVISLTQGLYLHRTTQIQKNTHTSMPQVGFESMIPVFELLKTVYALDCV
jgi:hypothetical protein